MKDDFVSIADFYDLITRVESVECRLGEGVEPGDFYELVARVSQLENDNPGIGRVLTMDHHLRHLQEEVRLLRKSIEDYLLYQPEDLPLDDVI